MIENLQKQPTYVFLGVANTPISIHDPLMDRFSTAQPSFNLIVNVDALNVRKDPSLSSEIVYILEKGYTVLSRSEEQSLDGIHWLKVYYSMTDSGWVDSRYLSNSSETSITSSIMP